MCSGDRDLRPHPTNRLKNADTGYFRPSRVGSKKKKEKRVRSAVVLRQRVGPNSIGTAHWQYRTTDLVAMAIGWLADDRMGV